MGNELLTPPELEPGKLRPQEEEPALLLEVDGSMWKSLLSNLRDAFSSSKQAPLQLTSQPYENTDVSESLKDESVWKSLRANIHDVFFPIKQPPLQLTSQPDTSNHLVETLTEASIWGRSGPTFRMFSFRRSFLRWS